MKKILTLCFSMLLISSTSLTTISCQHQLLEATNLTTWSNKDVKNSINLQQLLEKDSNNKTFTTAYTFIGQEDQTKKTNTKYQPVTDATDGKNSFTNLVADILAKNLGKDVGKTKNWFPQNSTDQSIMNYTISNILAYFNYQIAINNNPVSENAPQVINKDDHLHLVISFDKYANFTNETSNIVIINKNTDKFIGTATYDLVADWL